MLAEREGTRALTALFRYIVQTNPTVKGDVLRGLLPGDRGAEVKEAVMNWFETEVDCGERRGEHKHAQRILVKLLRVRFGELPASVVARVEAAETPELDVWAERVVTASPARGCAEPTCVAPRSRRP